ncbi:MAG: thioredoxin domain-containing protein [Gammaproteobacteria bacterium]|nr:thioredoxin domain-containing protein [Gammaproteobacteria bacterium]
MSKRDQQKLRKEQKQLSAQRKQQTQQLMFKVGLYVVAPLFVLLVLFTLFSQDPTYTPVEVVQSDHVRGNADAPVTIMVYADFQCPACASENQLVSRAWASIRDKAHLVFRHYPITDSHPNAWTASLYAEAASKQGRFWEMHDFLFLNQDLWAPLSDPKAEFDNYAGELNLDLEQLQQDMESDAVVQKVRADQRGGTRSGVRSTPTIFINGDLVTVSTVTRLIELVESAYEDAADS